jgi:hypothetical protein
MPFLRKYNVTLTGGTLIRIPIVKRGVVDFAVGADWTPGAGDVKISKDGGAAANIGTLPSAVAMGNTAYWEFTLTGTELSAKQVVVTVADSATKAVEDQSFIVETFGDASAMYQADLSAANLPANVTQCGGTNGTFSGGKPAVTLAAVDISGTPSVALTGAQSISALTITGAFLVQGGTTFTSATGNGFTCSSTGGNGNGIHATGNGSGDGAHGEGGATGRGLHLLGGSSSGAGMLVVNQDGNSPEIDANLTGTVSGSVGSISGVTFPTNFAALLINASGHVSRVTLTDTVTTYTGNTVQTGDAFARLGAPAGASVSADIATKPTLAAILAGGDVDGFTLEETLKLCLAALAGKVSGAATTTITIRSADDSANRLVATVDADGNRSAVTLNAAG